MHLAKPLGNSRGLSLRPRVSRSPFHQRRHQRCPCVAYSVSTDAQRLQQQQKQQQSTERGAHESSRPEEAVQVPSQGTASEYLASFGLLGLEGSAAHTAAAAAAQLSSTNGNGQVTNVSLAQQFLAGFEAGQDAAAGAQQQEQQQRINPPSNSAAQFLASFSNPSAREEQAQQGERQEGVAAAAAGATTEDAEEGDVASPSGGLEQSPFCFAAPEEGQEDVDPEKILFAQTVQGPDVGTKFFPYLRAEDAWAEFEKRLEADLQTVANTLLALFAVVSYWRGIWALLDHVFGDNPLGDFVCVLMGLGIIIYIRLTGLRIGSFWPSL